MQQNFFLLTNATGSIQAGANQQARLDDFTERLYGNEFYIPVERTVPSQCIDGRTGASSVAPNAAGGSETLLVADDLTSRRLAADDGTTLGAYRNLLALLRSGGLPIGGHTDTHASGAKSGCGANDRLLEVYGFIAEHGDELRALADQLGVSVADATHEHILRRAHERTAFSDGADLLAALRELGGDEAVSTLRGAHKEVVAVVNTVAGTTLDRSALEAAFGPDYEAFNVDVWSFSDAAKAISLEPTEIHEKMVAMVYYNLATAHVLCGPAMRVIVRG